MAFNRASSPEYDAWASIIGDQSWGWSSLLPYFIRSVSLTLPPLDPYGDVSPVVASESSEQPFEGFDGPITVSALFSGRFPGLTVDGR